MSDHSTVIATVVDDFSHDKITTSRNDSKVIIDFTNRSQELTDVIRRTSRGALVEPQKFVEFSHELSNFHAVKVNKLAEFLKTNISKGMSSVEVTRLLQENGPNKLPASKELPLFVKFLLCFTSGFSPLLWVAFVFVFLSYKPFGTPPSNIYNLALALAIILVIVISALFQFYQEIQTNKALASFKTLLANTCLVIRDGQTLTIDPVNLVVGDIVSLETGMKIPSDMRIVTCSDLKIDKSMLTGENEAIKLTSEQVNSSVPLLESPNIAFMGCNIVQGEGVGMVIATGNNNQLAKIINQMHVVKATTTSLQRDINRFVVIIGIFAFVTACIVIIEWATYLNVQHKGFMTPSSMIANAISVFVAYIPEGLPLSLSTGLTLISTRLCKVHSVLVKQLSIIETVGSMTLLASDKTGTLTQNKMTVSNIISVSNIYKPEDITPSEEHSTYIHEIMKASILCNQSKLEIIDIVTNKREAKGSNGIDKALLNYAELYNYVDNIQSLYSIRLVIPFSSSTKISITVVSLNESESKESKKTAPIFTIIMKGAPEYVLDRCTTYYDESTNEKKVLSAEATKIILENISDVSSSGKRVIAVAMDNSSKFSRDYKFTSEPSPNFPVNNMTFVAAIAVSDPPRVGVKEAVGTLRRAGIQVAMVTGDAPGTALAIANQVGIIQDGDNLKSIDSLNAFNTYEQQKLIDGGDVEEGEITKLREIIKKQKSDKSVDKSVELVDYSKVKSDNISDFVKTSSIIIDGRDLEVVSNLGWDYIFSHSELVFARTTPDQKQLIVKESQRRGHRVGVTGDGVNDSPALKRADVGIAMGKSGSDVARDAAAIVLLNDDFTAIVHAVEEGRLIFSNLRKVIGYQIAAGCWSELIPVLATFFLGMPQPLSSFLMIIISCTTDVLAGIALCNEPPEKEILLEKPRDLKKSQLVDFKLIGYSYLFYGNIQSVGSFINYFLYMAERGNTRAVPNPVPADDDGQRHFPAGYRAVQLIGAWNWEVNSDNLGKDEIAASSVASSVFFVTLAVCQMGHLLAIRIKTPYFCDAIMGANGTADALSRLWREILATRPAPRILLAWIGSALIINFFNEIPVIQKYTGTGHVPGRYWGIAIGWSILCFAINEIRKWIVLLYPNSWIGKAAW